MAGALKALGIKLEENWEEGVMVVHGCGGRFPADVSITLLLLLLFGLRQHQLLLVLGVPAAGTSCSTLDSICHSIACRHCLLWQHTCCASLLPSMSAAACWLALH